MSNQTRMLELRQALSRVIVGQDTLLDRLVIRASLSARTRSSTAW